MNLGSRGYDGRYRTVPEETVLDELVSTIWATEVHAGRRGQAHRQAEEALARWIRQGVPHRREGGRRFFDNFEVFNFMRWTGKANADPAFLSYTNDGRREVEAFGRLGTDRSDPARPDGALVEMVMSRDVNLEGKTAGSRQRLRMPLPYVHASQQPVEVEILEHPAGARCAVEPSRLVAEFAVPEGLVPRASLVARLSFVAHREMPMRKMELAEPLGPREQTLYTDPHDGLAQVSAKVASLAGSLAGGSRTPLDALESFWTFFFRMQSGVIHVEDLDPDDRLGSLVELGWVDCYVGSALFVALCRSRGIPARMISGYMIYPMHPSYHHWVEAHVQPYGWVPLDPVFSMDLAGGNLADAMWSRRLFGELDYRLRTECRPLSFTGSPGVPFPRSWSMIRGLDADGTAEVTFRDRQTDRLVLRDRVRVLKPGIPAE